VKKTVVKKTAPKVVKMSQSEMETAALYLAGSNLCWVENKVMMSKIKERVIKNSDGTLDFTDCPASLRGLLLRNSPMEIGEDEVEDGLRLETKDWMKNFKEKDKYCTSVWIKDLKLNKIIK